MKPRVLFVLHLPPPIHGASTVGLRIRESEAVNAAFDARYINLSTSESIAEIGQVGFHKFHVLAALLRSIREEVRTFRPDLVYLTPSIGFPGVLKDWWVVRSLRRSGCHLVFHLHNKGTSDRFYARWLYRSLFKEADVILLSERLYADIQGFVPWERVSVCPNGVLPVEPQQSGAGERPRLLFLSNLIPSKGLYVVLDACKKLKDRNVDFECVFAGAPSKVCPEAVFRKAVAERGLDGFVHYVGGKTGTEKDRLFAEADVFVFPTFYPRECFPLVILEAMSAGLPVVTTPEGAIPDMVRDGVSGFLCPQQDAEKTAACLEQLIKDPALRRSMGEKGRQIYREKYSLDCFENQLIASLKLFLRRWNPAVEQDSAAEDEGHLRNEDPSGRDPLA